MVEPAVGTGGWSGFRRGGLRSARGWRLLQGRGVLEVWQWVKGYGFGDRLSPMQAGEGFSIDDNRSHWLFDEKERGAMVIRDDFCFYFFVFLFCDIWIFSGEDDVVEDIGGGFE